MINNDCRFQILSLNGGGIKGVFTAKVLEELERKYCKEGKTVIDHFDMICGTSIGRILALGLAYGLRPNDLLEHLAFQLYNSLVVIPSDVAASVTLYP